MPPRPVKEVSSSKLEDIPCFYFTERSQWMDFKRALANCGMTWGLQDWMTTVIEGGREFKELSEKHEEFNAAFPPANIMLGEKKVELQPLQAKLFTTLGLAR